jgi:hypothetical protein
MAYRLARRSLPQGDARSVDELLNFIDGEGQRDASAKAKQKKKKGKKRGGKGATPEEQAGDEPEADDAQRVGAALPRMRLGASSLGCVALADSPAWLPCPHMPRVACAQPTARVAARALPRGRLRRRRRGAGV